LTVANWDQLIMLDLCIVVYKSAMNGIGNKGCKYLTKIGLKSI